MINFIVMRTKVLTNYLGVSEFPLRKDRKPYVPSNIDLFERVGDDSVKVTFDIIGYNSQFDATAFSLQTMKDAGVDINNLKGLSAMPMSKFKSVQQVSSSDHE